MAVLKHISLRLKGRTVWLYVDGARWHKGGIVDIFLEVHTEIHVCFLPSYQPKLNLQERIWNYIRREATTNCWFPNLELAWDAIIKTMRRLSPNKVRRLCNIN